MPDPWEEAAKQFKGGAPAQTAGPQSAPAPNEDWKVWQSGAASSQSAPPDRVGSFSGTLDNIGSHLKNLVATPYHAFTDKPSTLAESAISMNPQAGGPIGLGMYRMFAKPTVDAIGTAVEQGKKGNLLSKEEYDAKGNYTPSMVSSLEDAIPVAGPWARNIDNEAHQKGMIPALAGLGTDILAAKGLQEVPEAPKVLKGGMDYLRPRSSPGIVPAIEMHAERLGQSILPPGGLTPKLLESIRYEAPAIREFAQRTGNPLKTQAEGLKAAQGVGSEGVTHFNDHFLKPNADVQVQLPNNASPALGHVSTLDQINRRIGEINDLERATAGKSEGATMTAQERLGLQGEAKALRQKLYETLSQRTGVSTDEIRNMREGYGGQYTVANALESARMGRLDRTGRLAQGQNPLNMPTSITDIPSRAWTFLKGGEDAIANRQFSSRIRNFDPQAPVRPMPTGENPLPAFSEDEMRGFIKRK